MIGDSILRKVPGSDFFGPFGTADLFPPELIHPGFLLLLKHPIQLCSHNFQRLFPVLGLRTLVLASDGYSGGEVSDSHRRFHFLDILPAVAGSAERVNSEIVGIYLYFFGGNFGKNGDSGGRGVDSPCSLSSGYSLYSMNAGLVSERVVRPLTNDFGEVRAQFSNNPAPSLGKTDVHSIQIAGEETSLISTGTGANF